MEHSLAANAALFMPSLMRLAAYDPFRPEGDFDWSAASLLASPARRVSLLASAHAAVRGGDLPPQFVPPGKYWKSCPVFDRVYTSAEQYRACRRLFCPSCCFRDLVSFRDAIIHADGHPIRWRRTPNGYVPTTQVAFAMYIARPHEGLSFNLETGAAPFIARLRKYSGPGQPVVANPYRQITTVAQEENQPKSFVANCMLVAVLGAKSTMKANAKVLLEKYGKWELHHRWDPIALHNVHAVDDLIGRQLGYPNFTKSGEFTNDEEFCTRVAACYKDVRRAPIYRLNGAGKADWGAYSDYVRTSSLPEHMQSERELTEQEAAQNERAGMPLDHRTNYVQPTLRFSELLVPSVREFVDQKTSETLARLSQPQLMIEAEQLVRKEVESLHSQIGPERLDCPHVLLKKHPDNEEFAPTLPLRDACGMPTCPSCVMRQNMRLVRAFLHSRAWDRRLRKTHVKSVHPTAAVAAAFVISRTIAFEDVFAPQPEQTRTLCVNRSRRLRSNVFNALFDPEDHAAMVFRPVVATTTHYRTDCIGFALFDGEHSCAQFHRRLSAVCEDSRISGLQKPQFSQHNIVDQQSIAAMVGEAAGFQFDRAAAAQDPNLASVVDQLGHLAHWFTVRMTKSLRPRIPNRKWKEKLRGRRTAGDVVR